MKQAAPKILLFMSSYAPMFLMLGIRLEQPFAAGIFVIAAVASVLVLLVILRRNQRNSTIVYDTREAREAGPEAASYLATYLLPVVMVAEPTIRDWLILAIFIVTSAFIFFRSSVVQINPVLYILGYRVLAFSSEDGFEGYLLTKQRTHAGDRISASRMGNGVLIDRAMASA